MLCITIDTKDASKEHQQDSSSSGVVWQAVTSSMAFWGAPFRCARAVTTLVQQQMSIATQHLTCSSQPFP